MRNNGHTTGKEIHLSTHDEIVSSSNLRGDIEFCNDTFCRISGFSREELLNQPHNILRHPQMPTAAFGMLWTALRAGKPWMGMVKNRCKNGDHYWVDAYITPLRQNGQIYGYESVRAKADPAVIHRAERVYERINQGKAPYSADNLAIVADYRQGVCHSCARRNHRDSSHRRYYRNYRPTNATRSHRTDTARIPGDY
jgi:aerotaxis receptor